VLVLHGTNPAVVKSILENSLDPGLASRGALSHIPFHLIVTSFIHSLLDPIDLCGIVECFDLSLSQATILIQLTRIGLFGAGTYFAEHPCKIDQYTTADSVWRGGKIHCAILNT
jgi:hypothetical protein